MTILRAALLLALAAPLAPAQAQQAQPHGRPLPAFNCAGAEELEDDVFAVPFAAGKDRLTDAARANLHAATELLKRDQDRNACILGHAEREGGQQTSVQLAARRARAVREALQAAGIPESRLRSEARVAGFSRTTGNTVARSVSIVVMPATPPQPEPATPAEPTTPKAAPPSAAPQETPKEAPEATPAPADKPAEGTRAE